MNTSGERVIMSGRETVTERLLERATEGDEVARQALLELYRDKLRRMVLARMDLRISARVDASDIVQDTLVEASRRLDDYLRERPLPYFAWLRQLAGERIIDTHRRHIFSQRRSILHERRWLEIPEESAVALVHRLVADDSSPSERLAGVEQNERVMDALGSLSQRDREVLVMRHLEQLSTADVAEALGITERAVKSRLYRGLLRLRELLNREA